MPRFDGADYNPVHDDERLTGQLKRVVDAMRDQVWRTLAEVSAITGDPESSVSAQLRHLRKERFGSNTVNRRSRGNRADGLYEYQLILNVNPKVARDEDKTETAEAEPLKVESEPETLLQWVLKCDGKVGRAFTKRQTAIESIDKYAEIVECKPEEVKLYRAPCVREKI
jgi:hypothetical protein